MRRTRRAAALAAAIGMLGTGAAGAYPVNFGTAYTPDPAHGFVVSIPQWGLDRSAFEKYEGRDVQVAANGEISVVE